MQLNVQKLSRLAAQDRMLWEDLLQLNEQIRSPFLGHDFATAVDQARGDVRVATLNDAQGNPGFFVFQGRDLSPRWLGGFEKLGGALSDYAAVIAAPGFRMDWEEFLRQAGANAVFVDHLGSDFITLPERRRTVTTGLKAALPSDGHEFFKALLALDKHFVKNTERGERQLVRDFGEIQFQWSAAYTPESLDLIINEKIRQYTATDMPNPFDHPWARELLHRLAANDKKDARLIVSTMYAGSTWVASHIGLSGHSVIHSWFPIYNEELKRYSPGHVLMRRIILSACQQGYRMLDFGEGDSAYKRKYNPVEYRLEKSAIVRKNLFGTLLALHEGIRWRHELTQRRTK